MSRGPDRPKDATYQYDYAYNGIGRLDTLTYPTSTDGCRLKLAYEYQYGELSPIKDDNDPNTVPWQLNAMDAAGRVLDETLGAGVRVVTGFNSVSGRMFSRTAGEGGGSGIKNLYYEWDANDNLTLRRDYQQSPIVHEQFTYDNLDRVDYSQRNGVTNREQPSIARAGAEPPSSPPLQLPYRAAVPVLGAALHCFSRQAASAQARTPCRVRWIAEPAQWDQSRRQALARSLTMSDASAPSDAA